VFTLKFSKLHLFEPAIVLVFSFAFLFATADQGLSQTGKPIVTDADATSSARFTATAHIPYDFYVEGTHLPAGDYTISPVADTVVLFRNAEAKAVGQAFLVPTGESVPTGEERLVFVLRNGRHALTDVWTPSGKMVVTSQQNRASAATDERTQVALVTKSGGDQQRTADTR